MRFSYLRKVYQVMQTIWSGDVKQLIVSCIQQLGTALFLLLREVIGKYRIVRLGSVNLEVIKMKKVVSNYTRHFVIAFSGSWKSDYSPPYFVLERWPITALLY